MNKREAEQYDDMMNALASLGFDYDERQTLHRISMTLHRWHELECGDGNGHIERDEDSGIPRYHNDRASYVDPHDPRAWRVVPDREKGALKRLGKIINKHPPLQAYVQTDPRGAALYILRPGDVPEGQSAESCYNRGICVY